MARETEVQSQVKSYQRLKKWYLMPPCLALSTYKVSIKGKVEHSWKWSSTLPYTSSVVATEKGAFESPSTKVNLLSLSLYIYIYNIYIYIYIYNPFSLLLARLTDVENIIGLNALPFYS